MTGILTQAGKIQDAAINWQENRYRRTAERQQQANIYRQRMTSERLRFDYQAQDWTGSMGISPSGRFQVVEDVKPKKRIINADGIRWDAAWIMIIGIIVLCAAILLANLAGIGMNNRTLNKLDNKIIAITEKNEQLQAELDYSMGDVNVCTEAVKLNLVSGNAAQMIRLTAPTDANLTITGVNNLRFGE